MSAISTLRSLSNQWNDLRSVHFPNSRKKVLPVVLPKFESDIPAAFSQLVLLGECAIWEVLTLEWGQLVLRSNIGLCGPKIWMEEIITLVSASDSMWHELYVEGFFSRMEYLLSHNGDWETLSEKDRAIIVQESLRMVPIHPGKFIMGSQDPKAQNISTPAHEVIITKGFDIAVYPVTRGLFRHVMKDLPWREPTNKSKEAASYINFGEALFFCNELSRLHGRTPVYSFTFDFLTHFHQTFGSIAEVMFNNREAKNAYFHETECFDDEVSYYESNSGDPCCTVLWNKEANGYRLPTEAEWEYAARAGDYREFSHKTPLETIFEESAKNDSSGFSMRIGHAVFNSFNSNPVGMTKPNAWGIYDIMGNVWQWVWDNADFSPMPFYGYTAKSGHSMYQKGSRIDPVVETDSEYHILKGGSWGHRVPVTHRWWHWKKNADEDIPTYGFRIVCNRS